MPLPISPTDLAQGFQHVLPPLGDDVVPDHAVEPRVSLDAGRNEGDLLVHQRVWRDEAKRLGLGLSSCAVGSPGRRTGGWGIGLSITRLAAAHPGAEHCPQNKPARLDRLCSCVHRDACLCRWAVLPQVPPAEGPPPPDLRHPAVRLARPYPPGGLPQDHHRRSRLRMT